MIVQRARGGEELYQLTSPVAQGQEITEANLTIVKARTGTNAYIKAGKLPSHPVAVRSLAEGEFLPRAAVSSESAVGRRQVVVNVATRIPSSVEVGSSVEIWSVNEGERGHEAESTLISQDAIVLTLTSPENVLGGGRHYSVEVSIPAEDLPTVLSTARAGTKLIIVPRG